MPTPTAPTQTELITEALYVAGESSPSTALIGRANFWFDEIKNDIWRKEKTLKSLQRTCYAILQPGQSRYAYPSSFSSDLSLTILDGSNTGTAQAGTTSSITLAATDASLSGDLIGREIIVSAGVGVGSFSQITAYNSATKVASVVPDFETAPDSTSAYLIKDSEYDVEPRPLGDFKQFQLTGNQRPRYFFPIGDEDAGEFIFNCPPDKVYGVRIRYYSNIMTLDTASTLFSNLLMKWRNIWVQGIVYRKLRDADDDRSNDEYSKYQRELQTLITREKYGTDMSFLRDKVSDFA